ncbi:male-specific lethal 3 homolog [Toxorhynchites rutilus septentrionalis]|uniref:male-specific lethal 3 homolog n=1 Tax=Toxorhynchites rutilus septentrionalis TaxID=329112 RepID=UPI002479C657|nr:male-specific lethal 3 homolog [Toxorhynchites rutilus septentrionalis]
MVSTRTYKYKFADGEKVLCYEPDPTKAKVLYDSKVLEVSEGKDKRGRRLIEYLIHFQGWNSSWDRKVSEDFILKDTEENRQLQKDLAEKSQLHQGTYLYRKERKKRDKSLTARIECLTTGAPKPSQVNQGSSEEGSSCSNGFSRDEGEFNIDALDGDTEYYSSSVESSHEEDKVYIQVGDKLKRYLEFDHSMISENNLIEIPAKIPIVTILENFVRHYTIRQLFDLGQEQAKHRRRNSSFLKGDQKTKDYEAIRANVELCKEVADGLRLYFDFTLKDYLLYPRERHQAELVLSEEYLTNFTYIATPSFSLDLLTIRLESPVTEPGVEQADPSSAGSYATAQEEKKRRRLRSHKNEENEFILDLGFIKPETLSPGNTNALTFSLLKTAFPTNVTISYQAKEILEDALEWKILPSNAPAEPSMIYGAPHLARLIVKLPEFLSATTMVDEKLKLLLKFLDCFSEFMEDHEELFGRQMYTDKGAMGDVVKLEGDVGLAATDTSGMSCMRIKEEHLGLQDAGLIPGPLLSDVKVELP